MNGVTRDYSGKQVDLEFLQTVREPVDAVELSMSAVRGPSRRVAGIQKAIQRYVALLLTPSASVPFSDDDGNVLYAALSAGSVSNLGYLRHLFNMANAVALDIMRRDDYNITQFGAQPPDERVESVSLSGMAIDHATSTLSLSLTFRTAAGSDYSYILPISTSHG